MNNSKPENGPGTDEGQAGLTRKTLLARGGGLAVGTFAALGPLSGAAAASGLVEERRGQQAAVRPKPYSIASEKRFSSVDVIVDSTPLGLDPHKTTASESSPFYHMHEALMTLLPWNHQLVPTLAAEPPKQLDGKTWRVRMRDDRTFTDGTPITADDVRFSFLRILAPATAAPFADYVKFINAIRVINKHTLEFHTNIAVPADVFPGRLALGRVLSRKALKRGSKRFSLDPGITSGSMVNAAPLQQNTIKLRRYEKYNGVLPVNADTATWRYVTDVGTRIAQLRAGQTDLLQDLAARDLAAIGSSGVTNKASTANSSTYLETIMFNCGKKPFSDQRVRQAVMYAIDRDQLIKVGSKGVGVIADSPLPKSFPEHATPSIVYHHDPDKAKSLLAQAGYGGGFTFELGVSDQAPVAPHAPLLFNQLSAVGLKPQIKVAGIDSQFSRVFAGNYDAYVFPHQFEIFGYDVDLLIRGWWGGFFNEKAAFWTTPGAKSLPNILNAALAAKSQDRRKALYARAQQIVVEEAASCPMIFHPQIQAWRNRLVDYKGSFTFVAPIFNAHPA